MKRSIILFLSVFIYQNSTAQSLTLHGKQSLATVFDSVLVKKTGLNCNQHYNKVISDYFKKDNYKGVKDIKHPYCYSKEAPLIILNGTQLMDVASFKELQQFKLLTSSKFLTKEKGGVAYGTNGQFGVFLFTAK